MHLSATGRVLAVVLVTALAIGGAGVSYPALQFLLLVVSLAAGVIVFVRPQLFVFTGGQKLALAIVAAVFLLPLLQLVPLPPGLWESLSGRQVPASVDLAIGVSRWRPLSLDVEGTLRSFLVAIPAVVMFAACLTVSRGERIRLLWVFVVAAAAAAVLSVAQVATGGALSVYHSSHDGTAAGLFVNRNHNAALMLCAMVIASAMMATIGNQSIRSGHRALSGVGLIVLFGMAVLGTTSRMGVILLPVALLGSFICLFAKRMNLRLAGLSATAFAAVAVVVATTDTFARVLARFSDPYDQRLDFWTDIRWALDYYGLVGTGVGSFVPVFRSAESLESVVPQIINHAHNDYLELLLESGLAGVAIAASAVALLVYSAWQTLRACRHSDRLFPIAGSAIAIAILLAASVVDYPMRMPALSCTFALLAAVLLPSPRKSVTSGTAVAVRNGRPRRSMSGKILVISVAILLAALGLQASLSARALQSGDAAAAARIAPWSTVAHEILSDRALFANDLAGAKASGDAALSLSPISVPAIRSIGLATAATGQVNRGNRIMEQAAILGWRDPLTQLWAIDVAIRSGEMDKAVQRAEALFRIKSQFAPAALLTIMSAPSANGSADPFAQALAANPEWRWKVLKEASRLPPTALANWVDVLILLNQSSMPLTDREAKPTLDALVKSGRTDLAHRLFASMRRTENLLANGDFEDIEDAGGSILPAAWHVRSRARQSVMTGVPTRGSKSGRALLIEGKGDNVLARQNVILGAGAYRLSYRARSADLLGGSLRWEFRCQGSGFTQTSNFLVPGDGRWRTFTKQFDVSGSNCPIQTLSFGKGSDSPSGKIWIDDVSLRRLSS